MRFRKKPIVIEAVQLRWDTWDEMCEFAGVGKLDDGKPEGVKRADNKIALAIPTLEGVMVADENDWVIRGVKGELYPCKPDIFEATYEPAAWDEISARPTICSVCDPSFGCFDGTSPCAKGMK